MILLWIVAYLGVGFGVAVIEERLNPVEGFPCALVIPFWPAFAVQFLNPLIRYCARRIP